MKALAATVVLLAALGITARLTSSGLWDLFDLDQERRPAAVISSAILGLASFLVCRALRASQAPLILFALPLFLLFMTVDEVLLLHERVEWRFNIDWQVLYSPIIAGGGVAWLLVLWRWGWRSVSGMCLLAGAVCWGASQVLEALQWNGDVPVSGYSHYMVTEELLEASGSAAFCLAGSAALAAAHAWTSLTRTGAHAEPAARLLTAPPRPGAAGR